MGAGEQSFFFGSSGASGDDERLFGVLHTPVNTRGYGVLLCAPFAHEHGFAHRMLVEFARKLAAAGAHVLRFDYRGHGDSSGAFASYTVEHLEYDVIQAIAELERRAGVPCSVLFGLRLGATLAVRAALKSGRDPLLVLWEPIAQGDKHLDEILRVVMSKDVAHGDGGKPRTRAELRKVMVEGGEVILEGHPLTSGWYASLMALDLYKEPALPKGRALIVQIPSGKSGNVRKELETLKTALAKDGACELEIVSAPSLWWGPLTREYDARNRPEAVFEKTIAWISANVAVGAGAAPAPVAGNGVEAERPVSFAVEGVVIPGILHAAAKQEDRARPIVVMLPQGMNRRTGWNRLYVRIARALAARGFPVLRFDARGFGDAPGTVELATGEDVFNAVQKGLHNADSTAAIDFARRTFGERPVVIIGVCGGAVTAGLIAPHDPRIAGAALVETELTYTTLVAEVEPEYQVLDKLRDPKRWLRLLSFKADYRQHLRSLYGMVEKRVRARLRGKSAADDTGWLAA